MIELHAQIERWTNVERVLVAMPEHERRHHWDMAVWSKVTACGTVACAAGTCGQDAWFRERGFRLDVVDGDINISNVEDFFGVEGSTRIFLDGTARPVETVIEEVRGFISELTRVAALAAKVSVAIGEVWPGQGGVFAGVILGRDGAPDHYLILGPQHDGELNWHRATEWATGLSIDDHRDFVLPSRVEQTVLYDRVGNLFEREWYWSGETHASDSSYAWSQSFLDGNQYYWHKDGKLRARAVRRLPIQ